MTIVKQHGFSLRIQEANADHHLYLNNGTWWVHFTLHPTPVTALRVRRSLKTRNRQEARRRRDVLLRTSAPDRASGKEVRV
jgi:hypothetical protein